MLFKQDQIAKYNPTHDECVILKKERMRTGVAMKDFYSLMRKSIHWCVIPCLAIFIALWPTFSSGMSQLQTDPGDVMLNLYFLEHSFTHLTSLNIFNSNLFWSPDYYWPVNNIFAWSDHMIGPSLLYGLFRFSYNQYQSYVGWISLTLFLNYISLRHSLFKISPNTHSIWYSLISVSIVFSNVITEQLDHPQLLSLFWIGPILVQCNKLICSDVEDFTLSDLVLTITLTLLNGFFNIYIFVYFLYGVECSLLIHLLRRLRSKTWIIRIGSHLRARSIFLAGIIGLNYIIYKQYLEAMRLFGKRSQEEILSNLPKIKSWFYGSNDWLISPPLNPDNFDARLIGGVEQELFPGWGFVFLMTSSIVTVCFFKNKSSKEKASTWLLLIFILILGSISINGFSFWPSISNFLPGSNSLRASSRVTMIIVNFSAPFIAISAANWRIYGNILARKIIEFLLISAGLFSLIRTKAHSFSLVDWKEIVNSYQGALMKKNCDLFWLEWNQDSPPWVAHIQAMHLQQRTGIPTINGHSGQAPLNNWPFDNASGLNAYSWLVYSDVSDFHSVKSGLLPKKSCIVKTISKLDNKVQVDFVDPKSLYLNSWILKSKSLMIDINQEGFLILRRLQENGLWTPPIMLKDEEGRNINGSLNLKTYSALSKYNDLIFLQSLSHEYPYKKELLTFKISQNEALQQDVNYGQIYLAKDEEEVIRLEKAHKHSTPKLLFKESNLSVYKLRNGELLLKETTLKDKNNFILLKKDGQGIKSERGDYAISGLKSDNENFYIEDTNSLQSASYIWSIDRITGELTEERLVKAN